MVSRGFVKLDCGILNSSLWIDVPARDVFLTALLLAEPFELLEQTPQLHVRSLEETGWMVPAGWYGFVPAAGPGIVDRAKVEHDQGIAALERLGSAEADSRTAEFDGRRLVRIDGGYLVLNFFRYRDRDYGAKERMRRLRERKRVTANVTGVRRNGRNGVTLTDGVTPNVTQAEDRGQSTEFREDRSEEGPPSADALAQVWNETTAEPLPRCSELTPERRRAADACLRSRGLYSMRAVFERVNALAFCRGENSRGWLASFDWACKPDSISKILDGNYAGAPRRRRPTSAREVQQQTRSSNAALVAAQGIYIPGDEP